MARLLFVLFIAVIVGFVNCTPKNTDIDIKTTIETKLKAEPDISGVLVNVTNGIVTIEGQCKDEISKTNYEKIAAEVTGVKTVINNLTVPGSPATPDTPPAIVAPITAALEDPLIQLVSDAIKKFPTVKAEVKDSIVILTGNIKKTDLPTLMKDLSFLKPKKIENKLTVTKNIKKKQNVKKKNPKPKKKSKRQ